MAASYSDQKRLRITFNRPGRPFSANGKETIVYDGLRTICRISQIAGGFQGTLTLSIFGLRASALADMFFLNGPPWAMPVNSMNVTVEAGGADPLTQIYKGIVMEAQADYAAQPNVALHISASAPYANALAPSAANSFRGPQPAADILTVLAAAGGWKLDNEAAPAVTLTDVTLTGSIYEQVRRVMEMCGPNMGWAIEGNALVIWDTRTGRPDPTPLVISPATGLVGYPTLSSAQVFFRTLFNPGLRAGMKFRLETSVTPAARDWQLMAWSHAVDQLQPGGAWFTDFQGWSGPASAS